MLRPDKIVLLHVRVFDVEASDDIVSVVVEDQSSHHSRSPQGKRSLGEDVEVLHVFIEFHQSVEHVCRQLFKGFFVESDHSKFGSENSPEEMSPRLLDGSADNLVVGQNLVNLGDIPHEAPRVDGRVRVEEFSGGIILGVQFLEECVGSFEPQSGFHGVDEKSAVLSGKLQHE